MSRLVSSFDLLSRLSSRVHHGSDQRLPQTRLHRLQHLLRGELTPKMAPVCSEVLELEVRSGACPRLHFESSRLNWTLKARLSSALLNKEGKSFGEV